MKFQKLATFSLGIGLLTASTSAFAEHQYENEREGWLSRYDMDGDYSVSWREFRRAEIARCRTAFERYDQNRDGVLSVRERSAAQQPDCEAWNVLPRSHPPRRRVRWGDGRIDYRGGWGYDRGVSWYELRKSAIEVADRDFHQADCDRSGELSEQELNELERNEVIRTRPGYYPGYYQQEREG